MATAAFKSARNLFAEIATETTYDDEESFSNDDDEVEYYRGISRDIMALDSSSRHMKQNLGTAVLKTARNLFVDKGGSPEDDDESSSDEEDCNETKEVLPRNPHAIRMAKMAIFKSARNMFSDSKHCSEDSDKSSSSEEEEEDEGHCCDKRKIVWDHTPARMKSDTFHDKRKLWKDAVMNAREKDHVFNVFVEHNQSSSRSLCMSARSLFSKNRKECPKEESSISSSSSSSSSLSSEEEEEEEYTCNLKIDDDDLDANQSSTRDDYGRSNGTYERLPSGLAAVSEVLRPGVKQRYNFALDREVFYANEAVDYLVDTGLASSRTDAVSIGRLLGQSGLIESLSVAPKQQQVGCNKPTPIGLKSGYDVKENKNLSTWEVRNSSKRSSPDKEKGLEGYGKNGSSSMLLRGVSRSYIKFNDTKSIWSFSTIEDGKYRRIIMEDTRDFFIGNMEVAEHTYRTKVYPNTFTGEEAVDLLVDAKHALTRSDAVLLGRALTVEYNLFRHVYNDHELEDAPYFYTFNKVTRDSSNKMTRIRRGSFDKPRNVVRSRSGENLQGIPRTNSSEKLLKMAAAAAAKLKIKRRSRSEEKYPMRRDGSSKQSR